MTAIGGDLSRPALVEAMVQSESAWQAVTSFCEAVMLAKKEPDRVSRRVGISAKIPALLRASADKTRA